MVKTNGVFYFRLEGIIVKRYLTTPIYYASGAPHLGHVYTMFLADCARRTTRMAGDETRLVTGTDEHGQKIERAAALAGATPGAFVGERSARFVSSGRASASMSVSSGPPTRHTRPS